MSQCHVLIFMQTMNKKRGIKMLKQAKTLEEFEVCTEVELLNLFIKGFISSFWQLRRLKSE